MNLDPNPGNGGHAFPQSGSGPFGSFVSEGGMSLRDWFAGQVLAGADFGDANIQDTADADLVLVAAQAYRIADAMLQAREAK